MEIIYKNINELIPYDNNPRINDEAVEYVKNSIKEFGFKVPIVIDKDNVIIAGHTRIKASKELGIKDIPCIIADDLTEEQVKAFRLADNKVAEKSLWDYSKLDEELDSILNIDMSMFDFNTDEIDWSNVDDLSDETYEEPEKDMLECPHCHHIDSKNHFRKIKSSDDIEKIKVPDFYVRQATLEDIDAIKKIADKNSQQIGFVLRPALEENCKKGNLLVAEAIGEILGFCNYNTRKKDNTNVIYEVCVDYKYRGNGIGKKLIDNIERPILLKCPVDNESNNFYGTYGFTLIDVEDGKKRKLNVWELK